MDISIRKLERNDCLTSFKWRNDPEIWIYTKRVFKGEHTLEDEYKWFDNLGSDILPYAIIKDGEYIGNMYISNIKIVDNVKEGKYNIFIGDKRYWNMGIGSKTTELSVREARRNKIDILMLEVHKHNVKGFHIYEKCGYTIIGIDGNFFIMNLLLRDNI